MGSTAHVLLEKDLGKSQRGALGSLKELGSIFGATKQQQYALIDVAGGRLHALDPNRTRYCSTRTFLAAAE